MLSDAQLDGLQRNLGLRFADITLLKRAFTHRSTGQAFPDGSPFSNQRLEFLGDSVLGLVISEMLYHHFPHEAEGDLSKREVALVNGATLAEIARELKLGDYLVLAQSEEDHGGRDNPSNLEDACEALIGAIYLDQGLEPARHFIEKYWGKRALQMAAPPKDPKTALQEWAQAKGLALPEYVLVSETGPAHAPQFTIEVRLQGQAAQQATATSKKTAERDAAEKLLKLLS
ncbi:MAG: ribonuclease III [Alphaproteobacteria bacterium]|nr:ribonuclease III [Alphaproteobacteria bacterium]